MTTHQLTNNNIDRIIREIHPGDHINISEDIEVLDLNGLKGEPDSVITISCEQPRHVQKVSALDAQHLEIDGNRKLNVQALAHSIRSPLVQISGERIVFSRSIVQSIADSKHWQVEQWQTLANDGIELRGKDTHAIDNIVRNTRRGITVMSAGGIAKANHISHFGEDGLRLLRHGVLAEANHIRHAHSSGPRVHNDAIQIWLFDAPTPQTGRINNVTVMDNLIWQHPDATYMQGIGCFDGEIHNGRFINNHIMTNHDHAITLASAHGCTIKGNTAINSKSGHTSWIYLGTRKPKHAPCRDNIITQNTAQRLVMQSDAVSVNTQNIKPSRDVIAALNHALRTGNQSTIEKYT